jgi:ketosteroid isomerase-like protein
MDADRQLDERMATRQLALAFLDLCFKCEVEKVLALLAPDATWWVLGNPERVKVSGLRDRPRIERFLHNVRRAFPQGLEWTIEGVTTEGERAAVEASSYARLAGGGEYRNRYHFLVGVHAGKVVEMREYLDTQYAYEIQQGSAPLDAEGGAAP